MWIAILLLVVGLASLLGAITITALYNRQLSVTRTFSGGGIGADNTVTVNAYNTTGTFTASSTPAVTKDAAWTQALTAGAYTIDLTAMPDPDLGTVTATGLKVQDIVLKNNGAAAMTIAKGASNGYTGLGASFSITLPPGAEMTFHGNDGAGAVGSGSKSLDVTGTGSQTLSIQVVAG